MSATTESTPRGGRRVPGRPGRYTRSEFTIDFLTKPVSEEARDLARVVARVKIPTMMMFDLIRDLNTDMTEYEAQYGEIPRVEED